MATYLWSNNEISFAQKTDLSFVSPDHPDFTLDFAQDKSRAITQVVAFKRDVWVKVKPKEAQVKLSLAKTEKLSKTYQIVFNAFQKAINSYSDEKYKAF